MKNRSIKILLIFILSSLPLVAQTEPDTADYVQTEDSVFIMQKSPWGAVLRSAIIPGWGQFYNESYFKIPVIWGFMAYYIYGYFHNNDLTKKYRDLYNQSINLGTPNSNYQQLREFYKDERDLFAIYLGITYFLNLVDAYVDAHLFDFDVSENPITRTPELHMKYYFN